MRLGLLYVGLFFAVLCLAFSSSVAAVPCDYCYLGSTCDSMYGDTSCTLANCYKCVAGSNQNKTCSGLDESETVDCFHWFDITLCGNVQQAPCLMSLCGIYTTTGTPCGGIFDCAYWPC